MHINLVRTARNAVGIVLACHILFSGDGVDAHNAARLTYARLRSAGSDVAVSKLREVLPQQGGEGEYILTQPALGSREVAVVSGIRGAAGDIHGHASTVHHAVEPGASEIRHRGAGGLEGEELFAHRLALARAFAAAVVHIPGQQLAVGIDAGEHEAER